jgi:hypothetical protein
MLTDTKWLLATAYLAANLVCVIAYAPQIWRVLRDARARRETVLVMWWTWTLGGLTEWLYATSSGDNLAWQVIAIGHTLACLSVALLGSMERMRQWWHEGTPVPPTVFLATHKKTD